MSDTPTTVERIDFQRLNRVIAEWHNASVISADDIPWLIEIARTVRYLPVTSEDVAVLEKLNGANDLMGDELGGVVDTVITRDETMRLRSLAQRLASLIPEKP